MYRYKEVRPRLFTEDGQVLFIKVRDRVQALLKTSGAFRMNEVFMAGDAWEIMACVDRLVELREVREIHQTNVAGQHRVFVSAVV